MGAKVRKINGSWTLVVHHQGKRRKKKFGPTAADKRAAEAQPGRLRRALCWASTSPNRSANQR
jgi:hypothetical protein